MKIFVSSLAAVLVAGVLAAAVPGGASASDVGPPNPLKWKTVSSTKCSASYKDNIKRGITLSKAVSEKRSRKSWGQESVSQAGNLKTTRHYHNYPLRADRVRYCQKGKVVNSYLPTKYKRYHKSQNFKKGGGSAWIPTFSVRSPVSGFTACYKGYLHSKTTKTRRTCNGDTFTSS